MVALDGSGGTHFIMRGKDGGSERPRVLATLPMRQLSSSRQLSGGHPFGCFMLFMGRIQERISFFALDKKWRLLLIIALDKGLSIYYVSSYSKAGSFRMLTNAYLREQGFIQKLMSYENPH